MKFPIAFYGWSYYYGHMLTQEHLKSIISYNPQTGIFHWKIDHGTSKIGDLAGWMSKGYLVIRVGQSTISASRLAWLYVYGQLPSTRLAYVNSDTKDNRIENLEIPSASNGKPITQERLRQLINYDQKTGILTWRHDISKKTRSKQCDNHNDQGYIIVCIDDKNYRAHRLAWLYIHGECPKKHIDHINGIRDDNRICNLREAQQTQNMANSKKFSTNKCGYKGVCWNEVMQKWQASITFNYKSIHIGYFDTPEEAHAAYCEMAVRLKGEFARFE